MISTSPARDGNTCLQDQGEAGWHCGAPYDCAAEANTNQYSCWDGSCSGGNGGTSYAAPQWAAFTALVNQQSLANGGATVGFLNPTLYRMGVGASYNSDFHDITSGSNGNYSAVTGFDLVTGWGSFNGPNLLNALRGPN